MTSPLRISTDESPEIAALRSRILSQKSIMASTSDPGYAGQAAALADLQSQLDQLIGAKALGPNIVAPPPPAPTFAGPRIDVGNVGVDALKLISYPGAK